MSASWRCWTSGRVLDWDTAALLDGRQLDERKLAVLDGRESSGLGYGVVAGWIISAGWAEECWIGRQRRCWTEDKRMSALWRCWTGGRVLDKDTAALLDGRQADERTLAMLDVRERAGLGYGGFAGWMSAG